MNQINKKVLLSIIVIPIFFAGLALGMYFKFQTTQASQALSDEQQGIIAVREAKASVVDIVGVSKPAAVPTGTEPSVVASVDNAVYGTGFVLDSDGTIISNNHVVSDPTMNYTVILPDGTEYPATILDLDKYDDVALLKINAKNLVPAKLGDSSSLETGQTVFAIGDSLGEYQYTVTRGVVSAVGRSVVASADNGQVSDNLHNLIQTDASINPGNSGGPLVNLSGEVIGMDTLIDTTGEGLGFAVPVNTIKDAVTQLKTFGKVSRPYLGVQFVNIDPAVQLTQQLSVNSGGLVTEVVLGTPAANAGILVNDIITGVNNITVNPNDSLDNIIQTFNAGSQVILHVLRDGQTLQIPVILGKLQ